MSKKTKPRPKSRRASQVVTEIRRLVGVLEAQVAELEARLAAKGEK